MGLLILVLMGFHTVNRMSTPSTGIGSLTPWHIDATGQCIALNDKTAEVSIASGDKRFESGPAMGCGCPEFAPDYVGDTYGPNGSVICKYDNGKLVK